MTNPRRPGIPLRLKTFFALLVASAPSVFAQNYPLPKAVPDPPAICTGCSGTNASGELNAGLPTVGYDTPIALHTGRFVDSSTTNVVSDFGMRTVRAGTVRVANNRLYLVLGQTLGAYTLDTFFTGKLREPLVAVNTINTAKQYGGRSPFEKLAKPDRFFYAESPLSNWTTGLFDSSTVLTDFDADDRGNVYIGTQNFGWGIETDPGDATGAHMSFVVQVQDGNHVAALLSLKNGSSYFTYTSSTAESVSVLYDVTTAATPAFAGSRVGTTNVFTQWSKFEAGSRVALLNADGHVRIYRYADLIAGSAPLADLTPTGGKLFRGLSFDEDGSLWLAESTNSPAPNILKKATPSGDTYTTTTFDVFGATAFAPRAIHAAAGYVVVAGIGPAGSSDVDVRLLKVVSGVPQLQNTNGFFGGYYHRAPSGFAQPMFNTFTGVRILGQGGKTYLFYSAYGLGDVYEISDAPRITSIAPMSGDPAGGTAVEIYGTGFTPASSATFDGLTATTTFISATHLSATTPAHVSASVDVVVSATGSAPMTAPRQFTYEFRAPATFTATATSTTSVSTTWSSVPGATQYLLEQRLPNGTWTTVFSGAGTSFAHSGRTADTTYVYRVRAGDGVAFSAQSRADLASTMTANQPPVVAGALIRAEELTNLRARVNAVRVAAGLGAVGLSDPAGTAVQATHLTSERIRIGDAYRVLGFATPVFTDNIAPGVAIKAVHWNELLDLTR